MQTNTMCSKVVAYKSLRVYDFNCCTNRPGSTWGWCKNGKDVFTSILFMNLIEVMDNFTIHQHSSLL